ncbi:MAG: sigma-70 family RNA polymerase sigma factor, partial [Planctomycetota bacterium]
TSAENPLEEPSSFDRLFSHFHAPLIRFVAKLLEGSGIDPEDVVQESLTKAWSNRDRFDPKYRFSTWVYTIARRTALDHLRTRRRLAEYPLDTVAEPERHETVTIAIDSARRIWEVAENALTADQYTALWLRYAEEMTIGEVAKALSKSTVSTRVLLHRARTSLRSRLQKGVHESTDRGTPS